MTFTSTVPYIRRRSLDNSFEVYGHLFSWLATRDDTGGSFSLAEVSPAPGVELPPSLRSRGAGALYLLAGATDPRFGDEDLAAAAGDLVLVPPGRERDVRFASPGPRFLLVAPAGIEESLKLMGRPARSLPPAKAAAGPTPSAERPDRGPAASARLRRRGLGRSLWYMGHLLTILASGQDTDGRFSLVEAEAAPGQEPPPHLHHREDEAYYVLEGDAVFDVGGERFVATPGDFVFLPRGVAHSFQIAGPRARVLILVSPAGFEGYFRDLGEPARALTLPPPPERPYDMAVVAGVAQRYGIEFVAPAA